MLPDLERAIGAPIKYLGRTAFDYLIEIESEAAVRALEPDLTLLARLPVRGVVVTARSGDGKHDFVSRFFAPASGYRRIRSRARRTAGWARSGPRASAPTS